MDLLFKSKKKQKRKKKRCRTPSSSSSSSSSISNDEWVEVQSTNQNNDNDKKLSCSNSKQREDWMSASMAFPCFTRDQLKKKKEPKEESKKSVLDQLGQSDRELNPYWKDGGKGLPEVVKDLNVSVSAVGDHGVEWLKRALHRAKEQAANEGRQLEDVVTERWGSLEKLESMIKEAESRSNKKDERSNRYNKYKESSHCTSKYDEKDYKEKYRQNSSSKYEHDGNSGKFSARKHFMKPSDDGDFGYKDRNKEFDKYKKECFDDESEYDRKRFQHKSVKEKFMKSSENNSTGELLYNRHNKQGVSEYVSTSSGRGWRKNPPLENTSQENVKQEINDFIKKDIPKNTTADIETKSDTYPSPESVYLSADERNELAAKLLKAEILGNTDLVKKLKSRLEQARAAAAEAEQTVILTRTDSKGFTQPLTLSSKPEHGRGRKQKTVTHEGGKRVRYFADDDKYSLQEMFQQEKRSTIEDQNEMFARLASKNVGRDDSAHDMDDIFEDMIRIKESDGKSAAKERNKAIDQHRRSTQAMDNCQWCLDGKRLLKHLVIAIGSKVYLCVPPYESLTEGHCLIVPSQHVSCTTQLDEDIWEEIMVFRKALVKMFLSKDLDVVFFECAIYLSHAPHTVWQCVPLPKESGDVAPVYFKKAIQECETEWASNKKLIDLTGKNVRRAVPRGLPYFTVDFGMQPGYAHVIEDEKVFPKNFAQEIIGGMLDIDHSIWRKPRYQKFEEQRKKVLEFISLWKPFSCVEDENNIM
ncbi:CWF19-like protein 2 [Lycorma delicatula]|uniref:CWF19-like protein 2 n=1 Tax=Lycorma delicatula TaxID=130591 RepID=UPI003F519FF2